MEPPTIGREPSTPGRRALIAGGVVLMLTTVLLAILFGLRACGEEADQTPQAPRRVTPAERTEPQTLPPMPGSIATESLPPTPSAQPTSKPDAASDVERIAFRVGATVYTAAPDGTGPVPAARVGEGPYALSPDGRTLAVVSGGRLALVDIASGDSVDGGEAWSSGALMGECPVWMPDGRSLLCVRRARGDAEGHEVRLIRRDGTGARTITSGRSPSVSPDGRVVAVIGPAGANLDGAVLVARGSGGFKRIDVPGGVVTAVAAADDRVFAGVLSDDGSPAIVSVRLDGSGTVRVAGAPVATPRTVWGVLRLSPDGSLLAASATGDDQVSRTSIIPAGGGSATPVDLRRDTYPKSWSPSGAFLYYVQGNAYQGEETALFRVARDGTGRRVIVTGAQ